MFLVLPKLKFDKPYVTRALIRRQSQTLGGNICILFKAAFSIYCSRRQGETRSLQSNFALQREDNHFVAVNFTDTFNLNSFSGIYVLPRLVLLPYVTSSLLLSQLVIQFLMMNAVLSSACPQPNN